MSEKTLSIILTGASGYLGRHLLYFWIQNGPPKGFDELQITALYHESQDFVEAVNSSCSSSCSNNNAVTITPLSCDLTHPPKNVINMAAFDLCIHTAAMSSPRMCEQNPKQAQAINVPKAFFSQLADANIPLIALSTDQVYDGTKPGGFYKECTRSGGSDQHQPNPLNTYAKTKWEMETHLATMTMTMTMTAPILLLRSSIILGPKAPLGTTAHDTFFHFCASRDGQSTEFYDNEYRSVVNVSHVCKVIHWMITNVSKWPEESSQHTFNLGGPDRVNRVDMAKAVFDHLGYDPSVIQSTQQTSSTVPLDISMDSTKLAEWTGILHQPETLKGLVEWTFGKEGIRDNLIT